MEIRGILIYSHGCMTAYTSDYLTFLDMRTNYLSKQCYLYLFTSSKIIRVVDFSKLLNSNIQLMNSSTTTWNQVITILDSIDLSDYICTDIPIPTYICVNGTDKALAAIKHELHMVGENELTIISAETSDKIHTGYGNLAKPQYNNTYAARSLNTDMLFTVDNNAVKLANTIPICNGFVCYPTIVDNTLYASQGAYLSRNLKSRHNGWMLVDFSNAGNMELIKLSTCSGSLASLTLPSGYTMKDKFVLLVINGRMYLPGEFKRLSTQVISFDTNRISPICELDRLYCRFEQKWNTPTVISKTRNWLTCDNSFIIMIDNPTMTVAYHECIGKLTDELYKFSEYAGGLLMDASTKSIIDYTRVNYNSKHFLSEFGSDNPSIVYRVLNEEVTSKKKEDLPFDAYTIVSIPKQQHLKQVAVYDNNLMSVHGLSYSSRMSLNDIVNHSIGHKPILIDFMFRAKDE